MNNHNGNQAAREAAIEKIRKLAKMTIANGCSENEANMAMAMLAKLSAEFNIMQSEVQLKLDAEGMIEDIFIIPRSGANEGSNWSQYLNEVCRMNEVKIYFKRISDESLLGIPIDAVEIHVFGYPVDVSAAIATIQIVQVAMKTERIRYKANMTSHEITSFQDGFASRINDRLAEMRRNRELSMINRKGEGQQLVVIKDKLVSDGWSKLLNDKGVRLGSAHINKASGKARVAGHAAASNVNLGGTSLGGGQRRIR